MKILILILCFVSISASAETFKIAGSLMEFSNQDGLLLRGCQKKCDAIHVIKSHKKIDLKAIRSNLKRVNSVGSDVCAQVYKAKSVLGVAENQDRRAFCLFSDQSMVEMNSLGEYLLMKKVVSE